MNYNLCKNIISLPIAILCNAIVSLISAAIFSIIHTLFFSFIIIKPHFIDENFSIFCPFLLGLIAGNEILKKINSKLLKLFQIIYFTICILYYFLGLFYSLWDYLILIIISIGFIYNSTQNSPDM